MTKKLFTVHALLEEDFKPTKLGSSLSSKEVTSLKKEYTKVFGNENQIVFHIQETELDTILADKQKAFANLFAVL
jgi:hypothetical protein